MVNSELAERMREWQASKLPPLTKRDIRVNMGEDIIAIVGPRRSGKTYFMLQMIEEIESHRKRPLYIDFEDIVYRKYDPKKIIEQYYETFSPEEPIYLFMDEIHNLQDWGVWLRTLHNYRKYRIMVTGSTSKLMLESISTELRGRYISKLLLPFSFPEYLRMKALDDPIDIYDERGRMKGQLQEYMECGGYPEVARIPDSFEKKEKLRSIYHTTLYRDIIERHGVREKEMLEYILQYLITNTANLVSVSKLHRTIRSNYEVSKRTVWKYYNYILSSLAAFEVSPHTFSRKKEMMMPKKIYAVDTGLCGILGMKRDMGRLIETTVYLHLLRRKNEEDIEIRYYSGKEGEVDFVLLSGMKTKALIQVCYDPTDADTKKRETKTLIKASRELKCKDLKIITWDYEDEERIENRKIAYIPLWKWLLEI